MSNSFYKSITVSGDRQSGVTEALITLAALDAARGKQVRYVTRWRAEYREVLERVSENLPNATVRRTAGDETVYLGNGIITFGSYGSKYRIRGRTLDSIVFDNTEMEPEEWEPALILSHDPRVYYGVNVE